MKRHAAIAPGEAGNVTLFFLLLVFVILGALSYSLYVGRTVQEKIKIDAAADGAALSMANHVAAGLNMVAVNNLAVAANLHTAAAIPFIGRYYAVARAMMVGVSDAANVVETLASASGADDSPFATGFKVTKDFTALLTKAAAGNTRLNRLLVQSWFLKTLPHGVRAARLDAPGSLPIPTKLLGLTPASRAGAMRVARLAQSSAQAAFCHAINASIALGDRRNSVAFWVRGLLASANMPASWLKPLEEFETFVQSIVSFINGFIQPVRDAINLVVGGIAGAACKLFPIDFGLVSGLFGIFKSKERKKVDGLCDALDELNKAFDAITQPPIPRFDGCGITHAGDFGAQAKGFAEKMNLEDDVGFVYPSVTSPAELAEFELSINHGLILAKPLFLKEELPVAASGATVCPTGWSWTTEGGEPHCEALLDGIDFNAASEATEPRAFETASGGVGAATGAGLGTEAGLRSLLSRTQWALGQAKAEYHPTGDDPGAAATYALRRPAEDADAVNRTRVQLFWPAWRGRNAPTSSLEQVLAFVGTR